MSEVTHAGEQHGDPALVGRRVEIRIDDREITAVTLDTGEIACRHARSFAKHRTITALEHARALNEGLARATAPALLSSGVIHDLPSPSARIHAHRVGTRRPRHRLRSPRHLHQPVGLHRP